MSTLKTTYSLTIEIIAQSADIFIFIGKTLLYRINLPHCTTCLTGQSGNYKGKPKPKRRKRITDRLQHIEVLIQAGDFWHHKRQNYDSY